MVKLENKCFVTAREYIANVTSEAPVRINEAARAMGVSYAAASYALNVLQTRGEINKAQRQEGSRRYLVYWGQN